MQQEKDDLFSSCGHVWYASCVPETISVPLYQYAYGVVTTAKLTDLEVELFCFLTNRKTEDGGLGRFGHFKKIAKQLFPKVVWNEWLSRQIESLCDDSGLERIGDSTFKEIVWAGCATAGKTFAAALFAMVWWLAAPHQSIVVLTSTTSSMVRRRVWSVIQDLNNQVMDQNGYIGHMVDSKTTIQNEKGDDKHAIFAKAVGEGETAKAAANIQGIHAPRILVAIDEATDVREAILMAAENLKKGCQEFIIVKIGNAKSRLDPLGLAMEPKAGWSSVSVENEEWETKSGGYCLHFDGFKSPNVRAGKTMFPFLYTYEDYLKDSQGDRANTLEFWMYSRGFPAPEGVSDCVISEALILNHDGCGEHKWITTKRKIAAWDPGFGGDLGPLYFGYLGDIEGDKMGIQITEKIRITFDPRSRESIDYQIARQVIAECQARGVSPECFGMDATAIGRGVYAIVYEEWSPRIQRIEFGGMASEEIVSTDDPRRGCDVYSDGATEIWFRIRRLVESNQIKGFTPDAIRQFSMRKYNTFSRKIKLEDKKEFKSRTGRSPDDADCIAVLGEVASRLGAVVSSRAAKRAETSWLRVAKELDKVYSQTDAETTQQPQESTEEDFEFEPSWAPDTF